MAFVYILENEQGKHYIGSTTNLEERIKHHQGGHTPSTKRLGNLKLVFQQEYPTLGEARTIEGRLKKLKRKDYIENIVRDGYIKMQL